MSHYDANLGTTYTFPYMFRFCGTGTFPLISDLSIIFSLLRHSIIYCVVLLFIASFVFLSFLIVYVYLIDLIDLIDFVIAVNVTDIVVIVIIVIIVIKLDTFFNNIFININFIILIYSTRSAVGGFT